MILTGSMAGFSDLMYFGHADLIGLPILFYFLNLFKGCGGKGWEGKKKKKDLT